MQRGVSERDVQFTEVEQSLSGMGRLEKLVLGIDYRGVSLRWYNIVTYCTSTLVQGMWLWHVVQVSPDVLVCVHM